MIEKIESGDILDAGSQQVPFVKIFQNAPREYSDQTSLCALVWRYVFWYRGSYSYWNRGNAIGGSSQLFPLSTLYKQPGPVI